MSGAFAKTKHFQISQLLSERLRYLAPGAPVPTVAELMSEFRVSQATITQALERLRRNGLVERPFGCKRLVVTDASERVIYRIVFIRPSWPSPDFDCLAYAIQEAAVQLRWGIDIYCYSAIENLNLAHAMESNDAAIFVPSAHGLPDRLRKAMRSSEKPIVFLRERPGHVGLRSVSLDDYSVGKLAAEHLLQLGHRRILALMSEPQGHHSSQRLTGWHDAMEKSRVPDISSLLVDCSVQPGSDPMSGAYEKFSHWLRQRNRPSFSALFCIDWTGAMAAMRALREAGFQIPDDVSLVTFAGEERLTAFLNPPLTTVEVNVADFARKAIKLVERALSLNGDSSASNLIVKPFLVERESTRRHKASGPLI